MRKILFTLLVLFFSMPAYSYFLYDDGSYFYSIPDNDTVMFINNRRKIFYTLFVSPYPKSNKFYKLNVTQNVYDAFLSISTVDTLDSNGRYIHNDNYKELVKHKVFENKEVLLEKILNTYTKCNTGGVNNLFCSP